MNFIIRAWCLLEVFYNTKNTVPFEVYLAEEQQKKFLEIISKNAGEAMLIFSRISTRQSTCWVMNDQLRIHSLIESSVGFDAVDTQVREAIAKALQVGGQTPHQPSLLNFCRDNGILAIIFVAIIFVEGALFDQDHPML